MSQNSQVRVAQYRAEMALELLPAARDNHDATVIAACIRVRKGWLFGHKVAQSDLDLISAFHAAH